MLYPGLLFVVSLPSVLIWYVAGMYVLALLVCTVGWVPILYPGRLFFVSLVFRRDEISIQLLAFRDYYQRARIFSGTPPIRHELQPMTGARDAPRIHAMPMSDRPAKPVIGNEPHRTIRCFSIHCFTASSQGACVFSVTPQAVHPYASYFRQ